VCTTERAGEDGDRAGAEHRDGAVRQQRHGGLPVGAAPHARVHWAREGTFPALIRAAFNRRCIQSSLHSLGRANFQNHSLPCMHGAQKLTDRQHSDVESFALQMVKTGLMLCCLPSGLALLLMLALLACAAAAQVRGVLPRPCGQLPGQGRLRCCHAGSAGLSGRAQVIHRCFATTAHTCLLVAANMFCKL